MQKKLESLPTIGSLLDETFLVEKYQRGYKWDSEQVRQLLEDIHQFYCDKTSSFYCLQPIIVTKTLYRGEQVWEVIDGQQRLTTTFLILKTLENKTFSLHYSTRERSRDFLENIANCISGINYLDVNHEEILKESWLSFIEKNSHFNNIDNYHFYKAYLVINNWFETKQIDKSKFIYNLLNEVRFIWHEIYDETNDSEKIFINFNKGKIPLDQADLIKAEFIISFKADFPNKEIQELKAQSFATEWNRIENKLQEREFWFFVSNDVSNKKQFNRIDFLFDLYMEKTYKDKDRLFSYYKLYHLGFKEKNWIEIKELFELINEWYLNRTTYHLIGFVLTYRLKKIRELVTIYRNSKDKTDFQNELKKIILKKYISHIQDLDTIDYHHHLCTEILVLFNIAIEENNDNSIRFPFDKLKTTEWNIEHIHAQNPKKFLYEKEVLVWLDDMENLEKHIGKIENTELSKRTIYELKETFTDEHLELTSYQRMLINTINDEFKKMFSTDLLSNLCLLDGPTNKGIGNNPFNEKRKEVLSIAKNGRNKNNESVFVPMGTQRVFSKFYNYEQSEIQMKFWGGLDRHNYKEAIKETIENFLRVDTDGISK